MKRGITMNSGVLIAVVFVLAVAVSVSIKGGKTS